MSEMPKRIWAGLAGGTHYWVSDEYAARSFEFTTEYIRRDPAVLAALPEVQALIAGAYEAAARLCWAQVKRRAEQATSAEDGSVQQARWIAGRIQAEELAKAMEALIPADALAARDAMIAEAVAKEREACAELAASSTVPSQTAMRLSAAIRKRGNV